MSYASWSVVFGEQPSAAKWNILGTNDAYFDSLIGSGTAWTSWTPTWTNFTIGNGTNDCKYTQIGKMVYWRVVTTLGTTSSMGTSPTFTLPVTSIATPSVLAPIGTLTCNGSRAGVVTWASTTTGKLYVMDTNSDLGTVNATNPFPGGWLSTYTILAEGFYEAA